MHAHYGRGQGPNLVFKAPLHKLTTGYSILPIATALQAGILALCKV